MRTLIKIVAVAAAVFAALPVAPAQSEPSTDGAKGFKYVEAAGEMPPSVEWVDPSVPTRAVLLCIHGLSLHKGNFEAFGRNMCKYGVATYAIDARGFGDWLTMGKHKEVDFNGTLADIKLFLQSLHTKYPNTPVIILGESMGGSIALHATAEYPQLIDGLVSSVPSGDRFNQFGQELKVGMHVLVGGFHKPMNIGTTVVKQATKKEDLRSEWENDPHGKMELTPSELLKFQSMMSGNFDAARKIKSTPVLFVQGVDDKLVHPEGTWKIYDSVASANREMVLSKTGEHLIFEEAQFSDDDTLFLRRWIDKNVAKLEPFALEKKGTNTAVVAQQSPRTSQAVPTAAAGEIAAPPHTVPPHEQAEQRISYWIELYRDGNIYRCNNKMQFKSGDAIRFHILPHQNGYAYIVMKEGSTGKTSTLFPSKQTGTNNFLNAEQDYPLPYQTWLQFDKNPGIERVELMFSRDNIKPEETVAHTPILTAYVSPEASGSKDLVPTRMKLSWDDPSPVVMADSAERSSSSSHSAVHLSCAGDESVLAIDVALEHH